MELHYVLMIEDTYVTNMLIML